MKEINGIKVPTPKLESIFVMRGNSKYGAQAFVWEEEDNKALEHLYIDECMSCEDISDLRTGCGASVIYKQVVKLGLHERRFEMFTPEKDKYIRDNFKVMLLKDLAKAIGIRQKRVRERIRYFGMVKDPVREQAKILLAEERKQYNIQKLNKRTLELEQDNGRPMMFLEVWTKESDVWGYYGTVSVMVGDVVVLKDVDSLNVEEKMRYEKTIKEMYNSAAERALTMFVFLKFKRWQLRRTDVHGDTYPVREYDPKVKGTEIELADKIEECRQELHKNDKEQYERKKEWTKRKLAKRRGSAKGD